MTRSKLAVPTDSFLATGSFFPTALLLAISILAAPACDRGGTPGTVVISDSAGIQIVDNGPGTLDEADDWSVDGVVSDVGAGSSPDLPLHRVSAVLPLADGVVVGTESPPAVLVVRDDTLAAILGGEGDGPGEFHRVGSLVPLTGDTLAVWDPDRRRISFYTLAGELVREVDLSGLAQPSPRAAPSTDMTASFSRLLPSTYGTLVLFMEGAFGPGVGVRRVEAPSYRITTAGDTVARFGPFPGRSSYVGPQTGLMPYPFGAATHATTAGGALVVGIAESPEFRVYGPDGDLARIIRWEGGDRGVAGPPVERWERFVAGWLGDMQPPQRDRMRAMLDAIPSPERLPAFDGLVGDENGRVWVGEYVGPLELPGLPLRERVPARRWMVFDTAGVLTATLEMPEGFQPHALRSGEVWGVFTDELDVESVRGYEIKTR